MGRGLGALQRRILSVLAGTTTEPPALTIRQLAALLERSPRRIRAAVYSLETRGLVRVENRYLGHAGVGRYGPTRGGVPSGMPTFGLLVWHPARWEAWDDAWEPPEPLTGIEDAWEEDAWHWSPLR